MAKLRTLWKVTQGFTNGLTVDPSTAQRPESKAKVYDVYVPANLANAACSRYPYDHTDVWRDERDGNGWRLYEHIEHKPEGN